MNQERQQQTKSRLETWKIRVEILAFIAGGLWAVATFWETVKPDFEVRPKYTGTLNISNVGDGYCMADFSTTLQNLSKRPFEVASAKYEAWRLKTSAMQDGAVIDPSTFEKNGTPLPSKTFAKDSGHGLISRYQLNSEGEATETWLLHEEPDTAVGFKATLLTPDGKVLDYQFRWDVLKCPANNNSQTTKRPRDISKSKERNAGQ